MSVVVLSDEERLGLVTFNVVQLKMAKTERVTAEKRGGQISY